MNRAKQVIAGTGVGLILLVGYWYWSMLGFGNEAEVNLIPPNFRGVVYILFDQTQGNGKEYEGGKRIYRIPRSGVLKTKFSAQTGMTRLPEYYWNFGENRIRLRNRIPLSVSGRNKAEVYVSTEETGAGGCAANARNSAPTEISYVSYIISEEQHFEALYKALRNHEHTPSELICDVKLNKDSTNSF